MINMLTFFPSHKVNWRGTVCNFKYRDMTLPDSTQNGLVFICNNKSEVGSWWKCQDWKLINPYGGLSHSVKITIKFWPSHPLSTGRKRKDKEQRLNWLSSMSFLFSHKNFFLYFIRYLDLEWTYHYLIEHTGIPQNVVFLVRKKDNK